ncbi:MAG: alpha-amylase family glycosyl hydrolase [Brevinematales bacterium]|nr:alpha-amylase family glycosyl hydrolase [Brevinematales bacterium]
MAHTKQKGARIYNLFPRLVGRMENWYVHFDRIKEMGFDWVYVNPFHYPGFSGSLYAPKDYYDFNPLFINPNSSLPPVRQLESMLEEAHKRDLRVIMDLVINHTAKDHPFVRVHPEWYKRDERGEVKSPGAWDNGHWVEWGDLAEIDNENSSDKHNLWKYWEELVLYYLDKGFDGFRADAAYQVPSELWKRLIETARAKKEDVVFFAESLGCTPQQTLVLAQAGFDYIFNSSKWWNYRDPWLLEQYNQTRTMCPSISFPESHDTMRLAMELKNHLPAIKQRILFTAFFSSGWMIPIGLEYGFRKKTDVVFTTPNDWEPINYDLTSFLTSINRIRQHYSLFSEETENMILHHENAHNVLVMLKVSEDKKSKALLILNQDTYNMQKVSLGHLGQYFGPSLATLEDLSLENPQAYVPGENYDYNLHPGEVRILHWRG